MPPIALRRLLGHALALLAVAAAVLLRGLLDPWLGGHLPFVTLAGAVAAAVWYGGYGPALLAAVLGSFACDYLFVDPRGGFGVYSARDLIGLAASLASYAIIIGFGEGMRASRRRAEQAAREAESRLSAVLSSIDDHLVCYDRQWRYTYVNDGAARVLGKTRDELLGRSIWDLFPDAVGNQYYRELHEAARQGRVIRSEHYYPPFNIWFENHIYPMADGVTVFSADVTERKRSEETIRSLFRIGARLNSTLDVDDLLDLLVQEAIRLVQAESGVAGLQAPEGMVCRKYHLQGEPVPLEYCWPPMHGLPGWLLVHKVPYLTNDALSDAQIVHELCVRFGVREALSTPILDSQGNVLGFFEIHNKRDGSGFTQADQDLLLAVSQAAAIAIQNALAYRKLQRAEESLRENDRRKDEFLATLAHELRNPLAPIRNSLHILRLAAVGAAAQRGAVEMMERQVNHLVRLVDDLLEVSRISRGKIELRKERAELAAILRSAVETSGPLIDAARHRLSLRLPAEPLFVEADAVRLSQVVANLLNNAAKYTAEGGEIGLAAWREGPEVVVSVRDTGVGIPADMLPKVFEMFTQVDSSPGRSQGGLGIGLTLVRSLVELHGGRVEARSGGPGQGSEFLVRLPAAPALPAAAEAPRPEGRPASLPQPSHRILVVDDNVDSAESLGLLLRLKGHDVQLAHEGRAALQAARSWRPEVVLLDIGMPGLDGYQVARHLRQEAGFGQVLLVALTGYGQDEDRRRSREAGFDEHLVKPVDLASLETLIASRKAPAGPQLP